MNFDDIFGAFSSFVSDEEWTQTVQGVRLGLDAMAMLLNDDLPRVGGDFRDIPYRLDDGRKLTLDVCVPEGAGPFPVLVYLHGGAWIWGRPATHRKLAMRLAEQGFVTMNVDYRLAPEHPFPCGLEDCLHAIHFAADNAHRWSGDPKRLVLAGDSAGANLAAACAIELASDPAGPVVRALGLLYGVFDFSALAGDGLSRLLMDAYIGDQAEAANDPRVSPILGAGALPPVHLAVGDADPLLEDSQALSTRLAACGTRHELRVYADMPHAFSQMEDIFPEALTSLRGMSRFLHEVLE